MFQTFIVISALKYYNCTVFTCGTCLLTIVPSWFNISTLRCSNIANVFATVRCYSIQEHFNMQYAEIFQYIQ